MPQRDVAQSGSALAWGARGRGFKSRRPDIRIPDGFSVGVFFVWRYPGLSKGGQSPKQILTFVSFWNYCACQSNLEKYGDCSAVSNDSWKNPFRWRNTVKPPTNSPPYSGNSSKRVGIYQTTFRVPIPTGFRNPLMPPHHSTQPPPVAINAERLPIGRRKLLLRVKPR